MSDIKSGTKKQSLFSMDWSEDTSVLQNISVKVTDPELSFFGSIGKLEASKRGISIRFFARVFELDTSNATFEKSFDDKLNLTQIEDLTIGYLRHTYYRDLIDIDKDSLKFEDAQDTINIRSTNYYVKHFRPYVFLHRFYEPETEQLSIKENF